MSGVASHCGTAGCSGVAHRAECNAFPTRAHGARMQAHALRMARLCAGHAGALRALALRARPRDARTTPRADNECSLIPIHPSVTFRFARPEFRDKPVLMDKDAIRAFVLDAARSGNPVILRDIADKFGISVRTAHKIRASLVASGDLPLHAANPKRGGRAHARPASPDPWEKVIQDVMDGKVTPLSEEQQKALLSVTIMSHPNGNLRVAAQNALTRLNAQSQTTSTYSPGIPLTDEARIDRLALMLKSQGLVIARAALSKAFPRGGEKYASAISYDEMEHNDDLPTT